MASWEEFEAAAPALAEAGRRLLQRGDRDSGVLATVRADLPPRIHPVTVGIVEGRLLVFVLASAKRNDLEQDGRFALHTHLDPERPNEFMVRGRASVVTGPARDRAAAGWAFEVDDGYELFELDVESAVLGERATADDWPPRYTSWVG